MRVLIVTSVEAEARAIGEIAGALVVVAGIGRTNAACLTTEAILTRGPMDAVISAGIAGALPGSGLTIGDVVAASACIYVEEGLITADGFHDMRALGFPLGDFEGNTVPIYTELLQRAHDCGLRTAPIATVATCSGTNEAAAEVVRRTGALAEAMEGAAVVHAARRLKVPAIEIRAISNTTGDRPQQEWDIPRALESLSRGLRRFLRDDAG
jgi:futalosine hydrolase